MPQPSTVNSHEVDKFAAMADDWWDESGKFKPLHIMNPVRLDFIRRQIITHFNFPPQDSTSLESLTLLDIGCGGGLLSAPMARLGAQVTGIDVVSENIAVASHYCSQHKLNNASFQQISVEEMAATHAKFHVILCMEVLEHVDNLPLFIKAACSLLHPGGLLIISTINRTMKALLLAKIAAEYIMRFVPAGTHDWRKFLTPAEVIACLNQEYCHIKSTVGMQYNIFANSWYISDNLDVNYIIVATK